MEYEAGLVPVTALAAATATTVATTAAATAAAAVAAAATTAITTTAAATAAGTIFAGTGFVDGKGTAVKILAVELVNRFLSLGRAGHFDKGKSAGFTRELVDDHAATGDLSATGEEVLQVAFGGSEGQVSNV